ncbi:MAG TPA: glycosyltransferase [Jatrophihabitantaceae bacterium]|jgi:GT2 family glycosyltransferase|nr:glycosyltransferase [Jatrophihabitantaceae bacterium]
MTEDRSVARGNGIRPGVVSTVVVNFRGADDTIECLHRLVELDFPADRHQIICVDNASGDDSVARIRAAMPAGVELVESPVNGGFTAGCNLGVSHARGEYVAFLNNDARPDRAWLSEAVAALRQDSTIGAVASKVLDWDGTAVDFVDAALTWYGMGYKPLAGSPYPGSYEEQADVLFATGAAMVVRTALFRSVGGFDERYFMFYEDVDLGWRLNLLGHRVRYVPTSIAYHKHHATMNKFGSYREWYLLERNALMSLYKNLEEETLSKVLAPALALSVRRGLATGAADTAVLDLQRSPGGDEESSVTVSKQSLTGAYAVDHFVEQLPSLRQTRQQLQADRVRSDRELMALMRNAMEPAIPDPRYLQGHQALVEAFQIAGLFDNRRRVLVVTGDPLGPRMAGPAIRAFNIAQQLSREHDVHLISRSSAELEGVRFHCAAKSLDGLRAEVDWAEIVIFQGSLLTDAPWLGMSGKILIPDLYDPMHIEQLEQTRGDEPGARRGSLATTLGIVNDQLQRGDFFLCASDKQRHFWLGQLAALGRLNAATYDADATMSSLVAVAPFGLPSTPPAASRPAIKGVVPGIGPDDKVIIWAGGIYDWFDPKSLIEAVVLLGESHPEVRLFFLGTQHPNPGVPEMKIVTEVRELADRLGARGKTVFFNDGWVPYEDRQNYLMDADVGVSTHFEHIETTFSFRTRILDYLWAGLPLVVTGGDALGDLVRDEQLGVSVAERDVAALAHALERCLFDEPFVAACRQNVARVRPRFEWSTALEPLAQFCRAPHRAADARPGAVSSVALTPVMRRVPVHLRADVALARSYLADGGLREVLRRAAGRLRRVATAR